MPAKKRGGGYSDRGLAAALGRITKAKRAAGVMKRARSMGLMSHSPSKYGVHYVPSGTSEGIDAYGADYRSATEAQRLKRKADGYYGRGEYFGKMLGGLAGGALGSRFGLGAVGRSVGSFLGDKAGDFIKGKIFGRGLYEGRGAYDNVHSKLATDNSLIVGGQPGMKFSGMHDETSGLTVSHTEFIADVYAPSSAAFTSTSYPLNPGLQDIFPQLSQIALNFEEYEFIQLLFHFRSTVDSSSTNNASGNTGTIILATDYASSAQGFKDKAQMVASHGAVAERITMAVNHGVECDPSKNMGSAQKTVRNSLIRDRDVSTLDLGKFQIAFQNTPSAFFNQQVGELWCTYTVHLDKPRMYSAMSGNVSEYRLVSKGLESSTFPLGTNPLTCLNNSIAMLVTQPVAGAIKLIFPAAVNGSFEIRIAIEGALLVTSNTEIMTGNVTARNDLYGTYADGTGVDSPTYRMFTTDGGQLVKVYHVDVKAASGGVDNAIQITCVSSGTVNQTYVTVLEINPFFAQSGINPAPIWVDSVGVVTIP